MDLGLFAKEGIVCAASKGLGRAVALALTHEAVDLVINARNQDSLKVLYDLFSEQSRCADTNLD
jgi:3-oxoacyl-[acyl-carrier protein] reductase